MAVLLVLLLALLGVGYYYTRQHRLAALAGPLLENATGTQVHIDSAEVGWDGSIRLHNVTMGVEGGSPESDRIFRVEQVLVRHDIWSLLAGKFHVRSLTCIAPALYLTEDTQTGEFNVERIKPIKSSGGGETPNIPEVFVREGSIHIGETQDGVYRSLTTLAVSGNLTGATDKPGLYLFTLRQELPDDREGPEINGSFDLNNKEMQGKLERFVIDSPHRNALPRPMREWWDRLEPAGSFPTVSFGYDPKTGRRATLELQNAQITLPYGEGRSRMTEVSGRFTLADEKVVVENLTGKVEGMTYVLNGSIDNLRADAPFHLTLRVNPLIIPEEPRYMLAMPKAVQRGFQRLNPSGSFKALVVVERKAPAGKISYDGKVELVKVKLLYSKFAYPLHDMEGEVRFNDDRVEVVSLHGKGPTGASVTVRGIITPPGDGAGVNLTITAVDTPVDAPLREALNPKQREVLDAFLDAEQYQRLIDMGLIQSSRRAAAITAELEAATHDRRQIETTPPVDRDALAAITARVTSLKLEQKRPVFDLGGRISLTAEVVRPPGPDQKYTSTITVTGRSFNILFRHWPYPLHLTAGQLVITPDTVTATDIRGEGLTGAVGVMKGVVRDIVPTKPFIPDLQVVSVGIPIDEYLIASIPEPQNQWLRTLKLAGKIDATGLILRNDQGEIDFRIQTTLEKGTAQPNGGRYSVDIVKGVTHIRRGLVEIESVDATHNDTAMHLSGAAKWIDGKPNVQLKVTAKNLKVDDPILDLVPPGDMATDRARKLFDDFKPTGVVDAVMDYRVADGLPPGFKLDVTPHTLGLTLRGLKLDFTDMGGLIVIGNERIVADKLTASYGTGRVAASGTYTLGATPQLDLAIDATNEDFCVVTRAVMPAYVERVINGLKLRGRYHLRDARMQWKPDGKGEAVTFNGLIDLTNANATVGVPITELNGTLAIDAQRAGAAAWPRIDLKLDAKNLRAANRLISPLSLRIASATDPSMLDIRELQGDVYSGQLFGAGTIDLNQQGKYRMGMTLQSARMDPIIYPDKYRSKPAADPTTRPADAMNMPTGILSGQLSIEGVPGDLGSVSGRGQVDIRNANMYELPVALAMLQLINFSWPSSRAFDRASTRFVISGDDVTLESIALEAPNLNIIGGGQMKYSTLALNVSLVTRNPQPMKLGPINEIIGSVKDEFVNIHVGGTFDKPVTSVRSFNAVKDSWREVFGPNKKQNVQPLTSGEPSKSGQ